MRSRRRRRFPIPLPVIAGGLVFLLVAGAVGAYSWVEYQAAKRLEAQVAAQFSLGQAQVEAGKADLKSATASRDLGKLASARAHFGAARGYFKQADRIVGGDQTLNRLAALPGTGSFVAPRLQAAHDLVVMALALCDAADAAGQLDQVLIAPTSGSEQGGARLIKVLKAAEPALGPIQADLQRADAAALKVNPSMLSKSQAATLKTTRDSIEKGRASMDEFKQLVPVLYDVLGANGPRTYLLQQLNPAELRPGGGFNGTYSLVEANQGTIKLLKTGQTFQLMFPTPTRGQRGYVPPPTPMQQFLVNKGWSLEDSNFFTNFPDNARAALQFAPIDFPGVKIDGVIGMDFYTVVALLGLTGPVTPPGSKKAVDAGNFLPTVIGLGDFGFAGEEAKAFVASVGGPLMQAVASLGPDKMQPLLNLLNDQAARRHLQVYFTNPDVQKEIAKFGWSGEIQQGGGELMAEVEGNYGGTKANYFLTRSYHVTLTHDGGSLHHHVEVSYINKTPPQYPSFYSCYVRLLVPADASNLKSGGLKPDHVPYSESPPGTKQLDGWFQVNSDPSGRATTTISFDYDTPWKPDSSGAVKIYMQKQPGTLDDAVAVTFKDAGHDINASAPLAQDLLITVDGSRVSVVPGHAGTAQLPSLNL